MKNNIFNIIVILIVLGITSSGYSNNQQSLDWLVGQWTGDSFGGQGEEVWLPMSAGTMVGTYKQIIDGKVKFYEFMIIEKKNESFTLKLKHFNPDMSGWEEKDKFIEFPFLRSGDDFIEFDGISFHLKNQNDLEIKVSIGQKDGTVSEIVNHFKKQ